MSYIVKSFFSFFYPNSSNTSTSQKTSHNNYEQNNINQFQNLFTSNKKSKKTKIFTTTDKEEKNGIFSFINKNSNNNGATNNNNSTDNNLKMNLSKDDNDLYKKKINKNIKYKECSLGNNFNGYGIIRSDNQNCIFMSITALPEYSYSSSEELRLADFEKSLTGNLRFYKIKNTHIKNDENSPNKNNNKNIILFNEENLFNNNIFNNNQKPLFNEDNNEDNIFTQKLDISQSPFVKLINNDINYSGNFNNNFFLNNDDFHKTEFNNSSNNYTFNKKENKNTNIKYHFSNETLFTPNKFDNPIKIKIGNNNNITYNNTINKFPSKEISNPLNNIDIDKLFSEKEKVSKVLNESIKKDQSVKDFLIELNKEYNTPNTQEILNSNENDSFNVEKNLGNSNGISLSQKNFNKYSKDTLEFLSPIKFNQEISCYNMELENDDKSCSKIEQIYNEYEKYKNDFNKKNYLGNKTYKKIYENIESNINEQTNKEEIFSKTFSNGFNKFNNRNKKNGNGNMIGRDENLYRQNLMKLNQLSINENDNIENKNEDNNYKFKKEDKFMINNKEQNKNYENKLNHLLKNSCLNKSKNKSSDSASTMSRQYVDIMIEYNLPKNDNDEIHLVDVDQLMKVKELKQDIIQKINCVLKNKNYYNYSIKKITLLTITQFLQDEETLINYHLSSNDYTLQAIITYITKKNIIPKNLVPKLDKPGYKCIPSISELENKSLEEIKKIKNFKIYNEYGEVEFKEEINLLGVNLNEEIIIEKNMIETGDKLDYWSIFKIYEFIADEKSISNLIEKLNQNNGKFISYKNKILIWEYKAKN